jgi:hypothetical protein
MARTARIVIPAATEGDIGVLSTESVLSPESHVRSAVVGP